MRVPTGLVARLVQASSSGVIHISTRTLP